MSKSLIGLKNVVFAVLKTDTATVGEVPGATTYDPVEFLAGAIDAQITPDTTEANIQYADDVEYDALAPDTSYTIEAEIAGLTAANMAKLQGTQTVFRRWRHHQRRRQPALHRLWLQISQVGRRLPLCVDIQSKA